ncbi:MAG: acetate/propionate family kinase [Alphaproteobacteria bacterium]|nr:MAG: acetate/propionate family kinase [Alphaproteobacteria bacterium]
MTDAILTLNAGSSSLKFAVFSGGKAQLRGEVASLDDAPRLVARNANGRLLPEHPWSTEAPPRFAEILTGLLGVIDGHLGATPLAAVGHRVVHGGGAYIVPTQVTPTLIAALTALVPLDPLHMPRNLAPIQALAEARPGLPQVVCFDTAFHHTMPPVATRFALPHALADAGLRRYGFHGLSFEYVAGELALTSPALAAGRVIVAHLGAGASLCALLGGRSIETTFGFSTLDGLVMATRCGRIDPGALLHLGRQGLSFAEIETMLYQQSGLLGVSGISGDVRVLLASQDARARDALELFSYRIAAEVGALASALGGVDGLVFTAGIGEHIAEIRAAVCGRLAWLGVRLDATANAADAPCISTPDSPIEVQVIATDEQTMIARHTRATLDAAAG